MKIVLIGLAGLIVIAVSVITLMIGLGGPKDPTPVQSIEADVRKRDRSDAPAPLTFKARDGTDLSYRLYRNNETEPAPHAAVLIHGSAGGGINMHEVARALQKAGIDAIAPDMRGHGGSGTTGDIGYVGQLEDDVTDLLAECDRLGLGKRRIVIGHSAGGGFILRQPGKPLWSRFEGAILLAPFAGIDAPIIRPDGGWAGVGVPRIIGLMLANAVGVHAFDSLPTLAFGVSEQAKSRVTSQYSFRLMQNFAPLRDWKSAIGRLSGPVHVLAGTADELFFAERYGETFGSKAKVQLIPGITHMGITGEPAALSAVVAAAQEIAGSPR